MARTIYEALHTGNVCWYGHWDLLWGKGDEGTLLILDNPFEGIDTKKTPGFLRTQSFHWFRHFSRFIRPGMQRLEVKDKSTSLKGVYELVFVSKVNRASTAIIINSTNKWVQLEFGWLPDVVPGNPRQVFYSTLTEEFTNAGLFPNSGKIYLKPVCPTLWLFAAFVPQRILESGSVVYAALLCAVCGKTQQTFLTRTTFLTLFFSLLVHGFVSHQLVFCA